MNILEGEMSLIGSRPTFAYQVAQYSAEQSRRLELRPGVTGWTQVRVSLSRSVLGYLGYCRCVMVLTQGWHIVIEREH